MVRTTPARIKAGRETLRRGCRGVPELQAHQVLEVHLVQVLARKEMRLNLSRHCLPSHCWSCYRHQIAPRKDSTLELACRRRQG